MNAATDPTADPKAPCNLCSLPVGSQPFLLPMPDQVRVFCCEGCKGIYQMLHQINETPPGADQNADTKS